MSKQVGEVLIKLLDRVPDAATLEILLEPENLLKLLQIYGQDKKSIKQALTSGKIPGELLMELLDKEPDTNRLLAQLGTANVKAGGKQSKPPTLEPLPLSTLPETEVKGRGNLFGNYYSLVILTIIAVTCIFPALGLSKILPNVAITFETATLIAFVGGAVAGAISDRNAIFSWKGMIVGIVYSLGTLGATYLYTRDRTFILKIEIAIPLLLGGIPALIVYFILSRFTKR